MPAHVEADLALVIADVFSRLPIGDFVIGVNNRKVLEGFYLGIGLSDVVGTLRIVDKLDKIGPVAVRELLLGAGATSAQADTGLALAKIRSGDLSFVDRVRELGVAHPVLDEGLAELVAVVSAASASAPGRIVADLKIPRWLDYYTGTVYETQHVGYESWRVVGFLLLRRTIRPARLRWQNDVPRGRDLDRGEPAARNTDRERFGGGDSIDAVLRAGRGAVGG